MSNEMTRAFNKTFGIQASPRKPKARDATEAVVGTGIPLPPLPQHHSEDWWTDASDPPCKFLANRLYTDRQLRARDLAVARVVLEAAAKVLTEHQIPVGNSAAGEMACEMTYDALKECRDGIRALEFKHD